MKKQKSGTQVDDAGRGDFKPDQREYPVEEFFRLFDYLMFNNKAKAKEVAADSGHSDETVRRARSGLARDGKPSDMGFRKVNVFLKFFKYELVIRKIKK